MKIVTACLVLAVLCGMLAVHQYALGDHKGKPHGKPGDDGDPDGGQNAAIHGCIMFRDGAGDRIQSDNLGPYCDSIDSSVALLDFFGFKIELAKNGTGRTLELDFADMIGNGLDPNDLPADEDFWSLALFDSLDDWRSQDLNVPITRKGRVKFGNAPKDQAFILYGAFGRGNLLTVTRISSDPDGVDLGEDLWTIQSFGPGEDPDDPGGPGDTAVFARQSKGGNAVIISLGSGPMPFKVIYDGT